DMLGVDDAFFQEHLGIAKSLGRLGNYPRVGMLQLLTAVAAANAASTAAGGRFEHDRVTKTLGFLQRLSQVDDVAIGTGRDRHTCLDHAASRFGLVAHAADHFGARTDEL